MRHLFENYLRSHTDLTDDLIARISAEAKVQDLKRNELLLQEGDICRHKVFIASGLLRTYTISADGNEHIVQLSPENNWTLDVESYNKVIPSLVNIGAVEPTGVLLWPRAVFNGLLADIPAFKAFSEVIITRNIYHSRQRIITALSASPEEKYEDFVRTYPDLLQRLPLRMIASYLGVSLKTLTRIRHAQLQR